MPKLLDIQHQPCLGWLRHTVRPLLRKAAGFCQAVETSAGGDAVRIRHESAKPYQGGCFSGSEGEGCSLSDAEKNILARVKKEPMSWHVDEPVDLAKPLAWVGRL